MSDSFGLATSHYRPKGDGQGNDPISIIGTYSEPVEWPLFGEQFDDGTASTPIQASFSDSSPMPTFDLACDAGIQLLSGARIIASKIFAVSRLATAR